MASLNCWICGFRWMRTISKYPSPGMMRLHTNQRLNTHWRTKRLRLSSIYPPFYHAMQRTKTDLKTLG
ncbi:hypothetical protein EMPG_14101 [Blastomyces silverae]|uniref:Uncharacterized protein n=1 Tax=Blastomyces silverae TaxID=2060906 RepID=A0A0H1BG86_9EURO|nr:hypothetical protein EMPG_14101 [Blastomyces silverae]